MNRVYRFPILSIVRRRQTTPYPDEAVSVFVDPTPYSDDIRNAFFSAALVPDQRVLVFTGRTQEYVARFLSFRLVEDGAAVLDISGIPLSMLHGAIDLYVSFDALGGLNGFQFLYKPDSCAWRDLEDFLSKGGDAK